MDTSINPTTFERVINSISDGFLFESFSQEFIAAIVGVDFIPFGGMHDRGIDGLEHCYVEQSKLKKIYQASIQKTADAKLRATIAKLEKNEIEYDQLIFVTNQVFEDQDKITSDLEGNSGKTIKIWDVKWLESRANHSSKTISVYNSFISRSQNNFVSSSDAYITHEFANDPRLYVFLRQQWEKNRKDLAIDDIVVDSLILFSLEGTDPAKEFVKTSSQIKAGIPELVKFDPKQIYNRIDERLKILSTKPRKIVFDSRWNGYSLPYETRVSIQEQRILDEVLFNHFNEKSTQLMNNNLSTQGVTIKNPWGLVSKVINNLYYQQGLEFSNYILNEESNNVIEKNINDIISGVIANSTVPRQDISKVNTSLLLTIREIVYRSDLQQKEYLKKLSNTYLMMFLLQWDPKVASYFQELASKLEVYVCTSILVPAISELFLESENRRHYNLLLSAKRAGVKLIVDEHTINELITHLQSIKYKYEMDYEPREDIYLDELQMLYVDEILIRSYYHAKIANKVMNFDEFLDSFVNPDLSNAKQGLGDWLHDTFGIDYRESKYSGVCIDQKEKELLINALTPLKKVRMKAKNDVETILTIYALREKNGEIAGNGVLGYRTWWLSKDTRTYQVVSEILGEKYQVSCYMRPDFLYNYITLAPSVEAIDESFTLLFPSLIGVNIGHHLDPELNKLINERIKYFHTKDPSRLKAVLRELSEKIKSDQTYMTRAKITHFLDDRMNELVAGGNGP